jgi:ammonia channel protein AmtB
MAIGMSLLMIAGGAILVFAVETEESNGFDINGVGVILLTAGIIGLVAAMFFRRRSGYRARPWRRRRIVEQEDT